MFSDIEENYNMLCGAYKKIKSYYYYNKNFLFMKKKIAEFEYNADIMESNLLFLANVLEQPRKYEKEVGEWLKKIDYYVLPKTLSAEKSLNEKFVTNTTHTNKQVTKANFFIDMPFELHLLETVWTLFIGKLCFDNRIINECCYGNAIDNYMVYNQCEDLKKSINFQKNKLFKVYFPQYCAWKNSAIEAIEKNMNDKSMALISLDIKGFYYSVNWKFKYLDEIIKDNRLMEIESLTKLMEDIFIRYTELISNVRDIMQDVKKKECVLPIGLFSSMLLANLYMSPFDKEVVSIKDVLYYGRYVDDMLLVLDVSDVGFRDDDEWLDKILADENKILNKIDSREYCIFKFPDLIVQREKLKIIYFERGKADSLITQLKKTKIIPSQMNVVPNNELRMSDFEDAAYIIQNFSAEIKIRDLGQLEINKFELGLHMADLVRKNKYKTELLPKEERIFLQTEGYKLVSFFQGSNALEYSSNWTNALYYFILAGQSYKSLWKKFEMNIREAIKSLRINHLEAIKSEKSGTIKARMKKQLYEQLNICIATVLALNLNYYKKESNEARELAYKFRKTNLFNHYLVAYPLLNYIDDLDPNLDITNADLQEIRIDIKSLSKSRKMKFSPRFIYLEELFQYAFFESISCNKSGYLTKQSIEEISDIFFKINNINIIYAYPLQIGIKMKCIFDKYYIQEINLPNKKYETNRIRIAVANIKLEIRDCCMGLLNEQIVRSRKDFINFLKEAYENENGKVDFLVFPEFYLPLQWISDLLSFVRKAGITVITGLQYIVRGNQAYNTIGIFTQIKSGKYSSSCMFIREKNDYAPFEKELLALKGYYCSEKEKSIYTVVNCDELSFGTFLCYEFTDILARGLYKDKVDILFTPENNSDTTYFSNIIETTTRDLHTFVVQSNTSIYGDSRITGPYSRDQRNIVQIKGGDNDSIIIGTIDVEAVRKHRNEERKQLEERIDNYFYADVKTKEENEKRLLEKHEYKISKTSARTRY
ncbi:MAG: hypothetical protein HDR09_01400 [Lachnospiraceae bacterium]|nr:hypothetical protein [Lachnospiraceae bacterium]